MSFFSTLARVVSGIATVGGSEIARAAAIAAGQHKNVRTAEAIVGAATVEGAKGFASGLVSGGIKGAIIGAVGSAALTTGLGIKAALTPQRVTPFMRLQAARILRPIGDTRSSSAGTLGPTAFGKFATFSSTGGNPAWLYSGRAVTLSRQSLVPSGAFWVAPWEESQQPLPV